MSDFNFFICALHTLQTKPFQKSSRYFQLGKNFFQLSSYCAQQPKYFPISFFLQCLYLALYRCYNITTWKNSILLYDSITFNEGKIVK